MKPTSSYKFYPTMALLIMVQALYACKGSEPEDTQPTPTQQELIAKTRNSVSVLYNGQPMTGETFAISFLTAGSFTFNTPGVPGLPQSGNWTLNPGGTLITLNGDTALNIITLTASRFVFEYVYTNHKMGDVKVRFTLE